MPVNKCIKCGRKETIFPEKIKNWVCSKCFLKHQQEAIDLEEDESNWMDSEE